MLLTPLAAADRSTGGGGDGGMMDGSDESVLRVELSSESGASAGGHRGWTGAPPSPRAPSAVAASGAGRGSSGAGGGGPLGPAPAPPRSSSGRARLASVCPSSLSAESEPGRARRWPTDAAPSAVARAG